MSAPGKRRTLFAIEREKRWRIWLLFGLLLVVVFASAWVVCFVVTFAFFLSFPVVDTFTRVFTLRGVGLILAAAKYLPLVVELRQVLVVQAAMPAAMTPIMLARLYGGRPAVAVHVVLATTLGRLLSLPWIIFWGLEWIGLKPLLP